MDTQARPDLKLIFKKIKKETDIEEIDIYLLNKNEAYKSIYSFKEYERVEFEFSSSYEDISLELECFDEAGEQYIKKEVHKDDTAVLSTGKNTDYMLVPGEYEIKITIDKKEYTIFYFIEPSNANTQNIENMRAYIESTMYGLSLNIYSKRKISDIKSSVDLIAMEKYFYLEDKKDILLSCIRSIIKNPIVDIDKAYRYSNKSKHPTNKSQRWLNQKGHRFNENVYNPKVFYEKCSVETVNTAENKILKNMLEEINEVVLDLLSKLDFEIVNINKKLVNYDDKILECRNKLRNSFYIDNRAKESIKNDKFIFEKIKGEFQNELAKVTKYRDNIISIKNNLLLYLNESWLKDIESSVKPTLKINKTVSYREVYRIYEYLREQNNIKKLNYPYKQTSKLFEIYVFLLIREIFEDLGFECTTGWLEDSIPIDGELKSEDYIIMEYKNLKLKITYEKAIERNNSLATKREPVSQISARQTLKNVSPDILIEVYSNDEFVNAVVVEMKYRRLISIHNENGTTKADLQLQSYREFDYYDGSIFKVNSKIKPISKVIAVYPYQQGCERVVDTTYDNIVFMPIMTSEDSVYIHEGYEELKQEIYSTIGI